MVNITINAVLAYEVMKYDYEDMYGEKQVYGQTLNPSLDNGAKPADLTNTRQEDAMVSYVGSLNYGYNDKYYAGFSSVVMALPDWHLIPVGETFGLFPLHGDSLRKTS